MTGTVSQDDQLYAALLRRDARFEGRAYVGVVTTGVFCRLTCPARKPKRENCRFYNSISDCVQAGFRPCRRCHPIATAADHDPMITALMQHLEADPSAPWSEARLQALGFDPSTVRRSFKRHFGTTFLELARLSRLRTAAAALPRGGRVIDAQLEAGYDSPAAFRAAFARWMGVAPGRFAKDALLRADWIETRLGVMVAVSDARALRLLEFIERRALPGELRQLYAQAKGSLGFGRFAPTDRIEAELEAFFDLRSARFDTPLAPLGSPFAQKVWTALRQIPAGQTRSYAELARSLGRPEAARAVARANGANPVAIAIPCHRLVGADGALTGYGGGLWRKQALFELEARFGGASH